MPWISGFALGFTLGLATATAFYSFILWLAIKCREQSRQNHATPKGGSGDEGKKGSASGDVQGDELTES